MTFLLGLTIGMILEHVHTYGRWEWSQKTCAECKRKII